MPLKVALRSMKFPTMSGHQYRAPFATPQVKVNAVELVVAAAATTTAAATADTAATAIVAVATPDVVPPIVGNVLNPAQELKRELLQNLTVPRHKLPQVGLDM